MRRKLTFILVLLIFLLPVMAAQAVDHGDRRQLKIVSLAPNITEILFELDLGNNICARTDYCNYPEQALKIPSIGSMTTPDLEKIISFCPDLVIASSIVPQNILDKLNKAGIKTYRLMEEYNGIDGVFELIRQTGRITGTSQKADQIIKQQKEELQAIQDQVQKVKQKKKCAFLVSWGNNGEFAATGDTFIGKMIEYAGGINAASSAIGWAWSKEGLLSSNPEVIFLTEESNPTTQDPVRTFLTTPPYSLTAAATSNQVYLVNGDSFERQGIRTVPSIKAMAELLYPELFQ